MPLPADVPIQFVPATGTLHIESLVDPSGNPAEVLDIDVGFTLNGNVTLPGWLSGRGVVRLVADEHGGPIDQEIGSQVLPITGAVTPTDPPRMTYPWSITVKSPTLPDESKMYALGLVFILQTPGGGHTDIGGVYPLGDFLVV